MLDEEIDEIDQWEREFRAAARADDYAVLRDHLRRLDLPDEPELLLEGTICMVRMCSGFSTVDQLGDRFDSFLEFQKYHPAEATEARYAFTFNIYGKAYARVFVETKVGTLDLADLYGAPWWDYKIVGFHGLWISHPDWTNLTKEEVRNLEDEVTQDLLFDYTEDEIDFWFDDSLDETYLFVMVQDVYELEGEDDNENR